MYVEVLLLIAVYSPYEVDANTKTSLRIEVKKKNTFVFFEQKMYVADLKPFRVLI